MIFVPPGLTRVSQQQIGATERTCLGDALCVPADVLTQGLAALATVLFAVAFLLALSRLHDAADALDAERERTQSERDAFDEFVNRVANITPENPRLTDGGPKAVGANHDGRLSKVVDAYRDTILDLPHYAAEYDDTLAEHMAAEFGEDVALAVQNGAILSPQLQRTLCATGIQAKQRRERLLAALDAEGDSLAESTDVLQDVAADLDAVESTATKSLAGSSLQREDVVADWQRMQAARDRTVSLMGSRQSDIHEQRHVVGQAGGPTTLYEYVYGDLPSSYPVLSVGTRALKRTRALRRSLSRTLVKH